MIRKYYDNTLISGYRACPRKFYFRHIRNWKPTGTALPLVFGLSWHEAMDVVWGLAASDKGDRDIRELAMEAFYDIWEREYGFARMENMDVAETDKCSPRTPGIAMEMLDNYISQRRDLLSKFKILAIEQPFAVPLQKDESDLLYVGRMDKNFKHNGDVIIGEHKTTSLYGKATGFRPMFTDSFSPNAQVDGYLHAGHMLYGDDLRSIWIDGALVHKTVHDKFKFIPIDRQLSQLDAWLSDTRQWIDAIKDDEKRLAHELIGPALSYMKSFRKNTDNCYSYNSPCSYMHICKGCGNPTTIAEPPELFEEDAWSPFDVLELDLIGLKDDKQEEDK